FRLHLTATEGTRKVSQMADLLLLGPVEAPSSAGIRRGKARLFEAMDGRVRAGRRILSNAGNIDGFIVDAQTAGRLSFGGFSRTKARRVTRWPNAPVKRPDPHTLQTRHPESCHTSPLTSGTSETGAHSPSCFPKPRN